MKIELLSLLCSDSTDLALRVQDNCWSAIGAQLQSGVLKNQCRTHLKRTWSAPGVNLERNSLNGIKARIGAQLRKWNRSATGAQIGVQIERNVLIFFH